MPERDDEMIAEISLYDNALYAVKDGIIKKIDPPPSGYGKQVISWTNGKVDRIEHNHTEKL